ncbi:DUF4279 domain-containing protein [uncultured Pelagimonas sp.]|uniref:DUF4279 domain-containing protein n=1 Tax=uncultured Pelagimonas sp. TaxID=1618102 RepID=UPI00262D1CBE|nr:DUF4279 domain-containing protein [uncultured Pelagimonas sp.]
MQLPQTSRSKHGAAFLSVKRTVCGQNCHSLESLASFIPKKGTIHDPFPGPQFNKVEATAVSVPEATFVSLKFSGDDLDPGVVSKILKKVPERCERIGDVLFTNSKGVDRVAKTGFWQLSAPDRLDGDLDAQIVAFLDQFTIDMVVWRELAERFQACIFCSLFVKTVNDEIILQASTLQMLSERGLSIGFDVY